ncbi:MAG: hypothetical protein GY679_01435 [Mycoplasma sp.]|nr:hypothetical protein [Mycoplasma sp.]
MKKILITGDWNLRSSQLENRKDDFLIVQEKTIEYIYSLAQKNDVILFCGGEMFKQERMDKELLDLLMKTINVKTFFAYNDKTDGTFSERAITVSYFWNMFVGDCNSMYSDIYDFHCLPFHKSFKWEDSPTIKREEMAISIQKYCSLNEVPMDIEDGIAAEELLKKVKSRIVVTGNGNNNSFTYKDKKQLLINPGPITRQEKEQKNNQPKAYLVDVDTLDVSIYLLPDNKSDVFVWLPLRRIK